MSLKTELPSKILYLIEKSPIYQVDLTRILNIKHDQRISDAVKVLLNDHKITRTKVKYKKGLTFLITSNGKHKKTINFNILLNNDNIFSPCTGCNKDCIPSTCEQIIKWINQ